MVKLLKKIKKKVGLYTFLGMLSLYSINCLASPNNDLDKQIQVIRKEISSKKQEAITSFENLEILINQPPFKDYINNNIDKFEKIIETPDSLKSFISTYYENVEKKQYKNIRIQSEFLLRTLEDYLNKSMEDRYINKDESKKIINLYNSYKAFYKAHPNFALKLSEQDEKMYKSFNKNIKYIDFGIPEPEKHLKKKGYDVKVQSVTNFYEIWFMVRLILMSPIAAGIIYYMLKK